MAKNYLQDLKRERILMLPNMAPETFRLKYDPPFKHKMEFFTLKHKETVRQHQKIAELKGVKVMKKMVNSTFGLSKQGKKVAIRRAEAVTQAKLERPSSSYYFRESVGQPIPFNPKDKFGPALFDKGCLTCGKDNIVTKYHGERHVCINCRQQIKSYDGDEVKIYLDQHGDIVCKAIKILQGEDEKVKKVFYDVQPDQLKVFEYRCFATYSGRDELIVLLHHDQTMRRKREVRNPSRGSMNSSPIAITPAIPSSVTTSTLHSPTNTDLIKSSHRIDSSLATKSVSNFSLALPLPLKSKFAFPGKAKDT